MEPADVTDHGTFIIGFTALTNHVTVGSEPRAFEHAVPLIEQQHLKRGKKTFQIPYGRSDAWEVLEQIIDFTIADKRDVQTLLGPASFRILISAVSRD